ncbi:hypothetical protein J2751_000748 [Halorubrum alkaliphilum]|uniref:Uncharacterized protein n=1 Tax=Halorubrum alkaliphilum TaxID=261290 RepID=A0A8T4GE60_9EURY|nr:hypothetical protein [Halorubrum alkaliphilum]MBP1921751.1 hypothetical protein [Halorubrum alkaliphilum]
MGLRCLLGHDFTEPEIEREREEEGEEVVTTVREVKTCARCGETQIVSENTEVTTIEQLADQATAESVDADDISEEATVDNASAAGSPASNQDPSSAVEGTNGSSADGPRVPDATPTADPGLGPDADGLDDAPVDDDAVILDDDADPDGSLSDRSTDSSSERMAGSPRDRATDTPPDAGVAPGTADDEDAELIDGGPDAADDTAESPTVSGAGESADVESSDDTVEGSAADDAETDDGVILDEEASADDADREHGAWPTDDESVDERSEPTPWPEQHGEDEGYSAETGGSGDDADVEFGGGLTPEATDPSVDVDHVTEYVEAPDDGTVTDAEGSTPGTASGSGGIESGSAGIEADTLDDGDASDGSGSGITHGESPELERQPSDAPAEYYCPECGMTMDTDGNSMRAGDICPKCKRGYVDERPR